MTSSVRKLPVVAAFVLATAVFANLVQASPRSDTLGVLDAIKSTWPDAALKAWINNNERNELKLDQEVVFHFQSTHDCHVSLFSVDSQGVATLLVPAIPNAATSAGSIERTYPPRDADYTLRASPPLGQQSTLVVCTERPLPASLLPAGQDSRIVDAYKAAAFARDYVSGLSAENVGRIAVARIESRVLGRDAGNEFTPQDVVRFFTERSRAIERPALDVHIQFDFNSSVLTERARKSLDAFGTALQNDALQEMKFVVGGHTDDVGPESYNMALSRQRAAAVRGYLHGKYGIDDRRLAVVGYGESQPLMSGTSDDARAANRRVEFAVKN